MEEEFYDKYIKYKFPGLTGPIEKTKKYNEIDYSKVYDMLEEYNNSNKNLNSTRRI